MSEQQSTINPYGQCLVAAPGGVETAVGVFCACRATSFSAPAGEIIVLQVAGDVDLLTVAVLQAALIDGLARRPCRLIIDVAEMTFCSGRGLALLVMAGGTAAGLGAGYTVTAASGHVNRIWSAVWPGHDLPDHYPSAAEGVIAAMTGRSEPGQARSAWSGRAALPLVGDDAGCGGAVMGS